MTKFNIHSFLENLNGWASGDINNQEELDALVFCLRQYARHGASPAFEPIVKLVETKL